MPTSKNFSTFAQQVRSLENDKKIIVPDKQHAEEILKRIGYFSLMGGYKHLFRIPLTKKYRPGTSFDEIVALYQFDAELRALFLKYLLQIERHVGNLLTKYRNACAHSDRLFTYKTVDQLLDTPLHARLSIPKQENQYIYGKTGLIRCRYCFPLSLTQRGICCF